MFFLLKWFNRGRTQESLREKALTILRTELKSFNTDGLTQLEEDLSQNKVVHGNWGGCPLSYRAGSPGSVECDTWGRTENLFTKLWDDHKLGRIEVLAIVRAECQARTLKVTPLKVVELV